MPEISRFFGMIVKMFFLGGEHNPPHIHITYNEYVGIIDIQTIQMIEGDLPPRALKLVKEWVNEYQKELLEMWNMQVFKKLPPLE
jgi:hypothetical protein